MLQQSVPSLDPCVRPCVCRRVGGRLFSSLWTQVSFSINIRSRDNMLSCMLTAGLLADIKVSMLMKIWVSGQT